MKNNPLWQELEDMYFAINWVGTILSWLAIIALIKYIFF